MSTPEPNSDPKAPARILIATVESAAQSQLDSAIWLWFHYDNPAAIHTLAAAANGCYHALGGKGAPTMIQKWIQSLSKHDRKAANRVQNFFKHGPERGDSKMLPFRPEHAELLMLDSVMCHQRLFHDRSPLMACFFARFAFENPDFVDHINRERREQGREDLIVDKLADRDRVNFLNEFLPSAPLDAS